MNIARMCQECIQYRIKGCTGTSQSEVKPGKLPCRRYEFDESLVSDQDIIPGSPPPSLKDKAKPVMAKPLIPAAVLPVNSKKAANFERLAIKRLNGVLDGMRKLENLSNKAVYEATQEQTGVIVNRIRGAVDGLEKKFEVFS